MEPLTWLEIASLIAKYGIPFVDKLLTNAQNNKPVSPAEWEDMKKMVPFDQLVPKRQGP